MNSENQYLMKIEITDLNNRRLFVWHRGRGNIALGLKVAQEFAQEKLGIPFDLVPLDKNWKEIKGKK